MAAASRHFESARSIEERKEQTRIARAEVLRQVHPFRRFWNQAESWEWRLSGSRASAFLPNSSLLPHLSITSSGLEVGLSLGCVRTPGDLPPPRCSGSLQWLVFFSGSPVFVLCFSCSHNPSLVLLSHRLRTFEGLGH